jgi:hypothetical protein
MKTLNISFDDKDFKRLRLAKQDAESDVNHSISWKKFLMNMLESYEGKEFLEEEFKKLRGKK